jgi:hypothetical protein
MRTLCASYLSFAQARSALCVFAVNFFRSCSFLKDRISGSSYFMPPQEEAISVDTNIVAKGLRSGDYGPNHQFRGWHANC